MSTDKPIIPLRERPGDYAFIAICAAFFMAVLISDVTSVSRVDFLDFEKTRAHPPIWPPWPAVEATWDYAKRFDHLVLHNPLYFRAMMWGDVFFTGPFYLAAIYAFLRGRNWLRIPAFLYACHVLSYAVVLTAEQLAGPYASPNPVVLFAMYGPFWLFAGALMIRLRRHRPFDAPGDAPGKA